jgi:hypothetical protein
VTARKIVIIYNGFWTSLGVNASANNISSDNNTRESKGVDKKIIDSFPKRKLESESKSGERFKGDTIITLPCGHIYHDVDSTLVYQ